MIASLFRKSTPFNYSLIIIMVLAFYLLYQFWQPSQDLSAFVLFKKVLTGVLIFASLFVVNFIVKKNNISKSNSYTILFFLIFLLFFPDIFGNVNLVLANFFILLSLRRLMSLHSTKSYKEKIFDASLWIFVAAFFHFWSILFILLVFVSFFIHVSRDYKNWILPFIALFAASMTFILFALMIDPTQIDYVMEGMSINFRIDYFEDVSQNIAFSIYVTMALFFIVSLLMSFTQRPLLLQTSYTKVIIAFVIGAAVFLISPNKSNELLIFTMAPLAMIATSSIEFSQSKIQKEIIVILTIILALYNFFTQL